jgi:hypothetical protein
MSTPNADGLPVTRQSGTAKAETGAKLKTAADTNNRMLASCQDEPASLAIDRELRGTPLI